MSAVSWAPPLIALGRWEILIAERLACMGNLNRRATSLEKKKGIWCDLYTPPFPPLSLQWARLCQEEMFRERGVRGIVWPYWSAFPECPQENSTEIVPRKWGHLSWGNRLYFNSRVATQWDWSIRVYGFRANRRGRFYWLVWPALVRMWGVSWERESLPEGIRCDVKITQRWDGENRWAYLLRLMLPIVPLCCYYSRICEVCELTISENGLCLLCDDYVITTDV